MSYHEDSGYPSGSRGPGGFRPGSRFSLVRTRIAGGRSLVEPLLIIVIGLALGLVDLTASEVPGMLRIPALITGLILVGQGLSLLEDVRNARAVEEAIEQRQAVAVGPDDTAVVGAPGTHPVIVPGSVAEDGVEPPRTPRRAYLALLLAIWLGVATLAYPTAPRALILLSLLSAYLLFARGWRTMQAPRTPE